MAQSAAAVNEVAAAAVGERLPVIGFLTIERQGLFSPRLETSTAGRIIMLGFGARRSPSTHLDHLKPFGPNFHPA